MSPIERSAGGGGGTASPLTTKGDVYTFSNTNARLAVGSDTQVLTANSAASTGNDWEYPPGHEFDYVEITAAVTVNATTDGNNQGTAVVDGNAVTYDGATRVCIEFYAPWYQFTFTGNQNALLNLYDGTNDLGRIWNTDNVQTGSANAMTILAGVFARRFLTPSAAAHTYHIRGWKTNVGVTAIVGAGAGGASAYMPAYYRITKA